MNRRWVLPAALLAMLGCMHQQTRLQSDDEADRDPAEPAVKTVGDITEVANADRVPVAGVGLVLGLDGTGGGVPPGPEQAALENALKKMRVENITELFNSKSTSVVRVAAFVPPGARKGDAVDVFVAVPENCRTTSLRGGQLVECVLYNYDTTTNVAAAIGAPTQGRPEQFLRGHQQVKVEGKLLVGLQPEGDGGDAPSPRTAVLWGGGRYVGENKPFVLTLNPGHQYARIAAQVAQRVNETFHGPGLSAGRGEIAVARTKTAVTLTVPSQYRLNVERFLRVVRLVPYGGAPGRDTEYVADLEAQLLDPATTITAALRLEALGAPSIPALKVGLNSDVPMVRFAAAEALAYLGSPSCGEELARQVTEQPFVQAFALTALASLNEAVCRVKLQELLAAPNPETRYGAWRALVAMDERDPLVRGEPCGGFTLHRVAKASVPQVHVATAKRPEVVIFGESPKLVPPFSVLAGPDFTLTARDGEDHCTLSRFSTRKGKQSKQCPLDVAEVLRALAEMGGDYADAVELLRQAEAARGLTCAVKADALPKAPTVYDLARAGVQLAQTRAGRPAAPPPEIATAPTLYERPAVAKADASE
jgi:hypothetical protein